MSAPAVCQVMMAHLLPEKVDGLAKRFLPSCSPPSQLLICYGGQREKFDEIRYPEKLFIDDPRLRTREHQREKQSYTQVFQKVGAWLRDRPELKYVYVGEYDHWPLVEDFHARMVERLHREGADVLAHELKRRDRTCSPYYLYHLSDPRFVPWVRSISKRDDKDVVLIMLGTGSFWTREAFLEIANRAEEFPVYLEIYLPTLAHHLGFRVRDFEEQNRFVSALGDRYSQIQAAREAGAWTIHPVKTWPDSA